MAGAGEIADQIQNMLRLFKRKHKLDRTLPPQNTEHIGPPALESGQRRLFSRDRRCSGRSSLLCVSCFCSSPEVDSPRNAACPSQLAPPAIRSRTSFTFSIESHPIFSGRDSSDSEKEACPHADKTHGHRSLPAVARENVGVDFL